MPWDHILPKKEVLPSLSLDSCTCQRHCIQSNGTAVSGSVQPLHSGASQGFVQPLHSESFSALEMVLR